MRELFVQYMTFNWHLIPLFQTDMASAQRILSCMDRALARCPRSTWHHDTSVQLWFCTPLSPPAWGWPSPTLRRLTALTHFPSEYQKTLGSYLPSIVCLPLLLCWRFDRASSLRFVYELMICLVMASTDCCYLWAIHWVLVLARANRVCCDVDCFRRLYWASCFDTKCVWLSHIEIYRCKTIFSLRIRPLVLDWRELDFLFFKFHYNHCHCCMLAVTAVLWS